jgi:hypothetical protein
MGSTSMAAVPQENAKRWLPTKSPATATDAPNAPSNALPVPSKSGLMRNMKLILINALSVMHVNKFAR